MLESNHALISATVDVDVHVQCVLDLIHQQNLAKTSWQIVHNQHCYSIVNYVAVHNITRQHSCIRTYNIIILQYCTFPTELQPWVTLRPFRHYQHME